MDASEDMQIMCFGDVYTPTEQPKKSLERPVLDDRQDSACDVNDVALTPTPAPATPNFSRPVRPAESPMSSPPTSPTPSQTSFKSQTSFYKQQASEPKHREGSIRSFFMPSTFKGKLVQCLVSSLFLSISLATYLTLEFTSLISPALRTLFILLILAFGITTSHGLLALFLFRLSARRASLLPTTQPAPRSILCEKQSCAHCSSKTDALPRDDSLYAPKSAIRVHLCRDEQVRREKKGSTRHSSSYATNQDNGSQVSVATPPPAYGAWRCSVRADPNLLHWQRVELDLEAGDAAAEREADVEEVPTSPAPISPTLLRTWGREDEEKVASQKAVRVSIGKGTPVVVDVRASVESD